MSYTVAYRRIYRKGSRKAQELSKQSQLSEVCYRYGERGTFCCRHLFVEKRPFNSLMFVFKLNFCPLCKFIVKLAKYGRILLGIIICCYAFHNAQSKHLEVSNVMSFFLCFIVVNKEKNSMVRDYLVLDEVIYDKARL